ncbi:MAG: hypothetical protein ACYCTW_04665 [Sulfuricella sp.]
MSIHFLFISPGIMPYNSTMSSKLSTVNPYLRDPVLRQRSVLKSVATSSAIEGIFAPFKMMACALNASANSSKAKKPASKTHISRAKA